MSGCRHGSIVMVDIVYVYTEWWNTLWKEFTVVDTNVGNINRGWDKSTHQPSNMTVPVCVVIPHLDTMVIQLTIATGNMSVSTYIVDKADWSQHWRWGGEQGSQY